MFSASKLGILIIILAEYIFIFTSPIHSLLFFFIIIIICFFILIHMQIEFFALIFFYIYIGNILFLFLFFIILSDDKKSFHYIGNEEQTPLFYRMYGILILILVKIVYSFSYSTKALAYSYIYWSPLIKINSLGDPQMLAYILFFHYFYCLILIAIMFLYTMIGITFLFADYFNK